MGEAGDTSDQEFLLKEEKLLLWVSFLPFLGGICVALTAVNGRSALCDVEELAGGNADDVVINRLFPPGALAADWNRCSRSVLRFSCWSFWKGRGRRTHTRVFPMHRHKPSVSKMSPSGCCDKGLCLSSPADRNHWNSCNVWSCLTLQMLVHGGSCFAVFPGPRGAAGAAHAFCALAVPAVGRWSAARAIYPKCSFILDATL